MAVETDPPHSSPVAAGTRRTMVLLAVRKKVYIVPADDDTPGIHKPP